MAIESHHTEPLENWFHHQGWTPLPFQKQTWQAVAEGKDGLIQAPTGSGKTYAAMGQVLNHAAATDGGGAGLKLLWVAPLRALATDIAQAAQFMIDGLGLRWEVDVRTGDTKAKVKSKHRGALPDVLITTPESLHILISQSGGAKRLADANMIVVDEWHSLLGSKRGVQLELALAWIRQRQLCTQRPRAPIWGVSATLCQPELAMEVLVGHSNGVLVRSELAKALEIRCVMPNAFERLPWAGHIGLQLLPKVAEVVSAHNSTLIFTNTRRQAEIWYQALLECKPEWAGELAMHHSSISKELRDWVEMALNEGKLRAVICTASLDLGVDFRPVDAVVQIGGPKGVARMIQRAGRCGHKPGEKSVVHFVPTHGLELVEAVALRSAVAHAELEPIVPLVQCWDVLVQWLCTLAVGDGFVPEEVLASVMETHAYREMDRSDWDRVLELIATGGSSLRAYTEHRRVEINEVGTWVMSDKRKARRHRMSMGTIVSATMVSVFQGRSLLGHVEESFVASLREGDAFVFAGQTVALVSFQGLVAKVRLSNAKTRRIPAWMGGRMSMSSELSHRLRHAWSLMALKGSEWPVELQRLAPMVQIQAERSSIPKHNELLVEQFVDRDGHHLFLYPFEGRKVHEALGSLLAYRLSLLRPQTFNWACNDDGLELLSDLPFSWKEIEEANLLDASHVMSDLSAGFNASEMLRRTFRDVATVAGLVFQGFPGATVKDRHLLTSTSLLLQVFQDHDPDNLLLRQAQDEMLSNHLEFGRLLRWLQSMSDRKVVLRELEKPSPLSFPLFVDRLRERLSSESLEDRLRRMAWN